MFEIHHIDAGVLSVAYWDVGSRDGWPCILGHGFPYDVQSYGDVAPLLADHGARVIVPYLRGYGPTRFLDQLTPRSGEQAVLGHDLLCLMDALEIKKAVLAGYDWGGRAACIVTALWPDRVEALVSGGSYNIQNIARAHEPARAAIEASYWYQYYFHSERGRRGLEINRQEITREIWSMWSPTWDFDDETFDQSVASFDNPDFVEVVIHSYRHRFGLVPGDPAVVKIEMQLAAQPKITIPAIGIDGSRDGVDLDGTAEHSAQFSGPYEHRVFKEAGHNLPQERSEEWVQAILDARVMVVS